jgi:hypothetical protein
MISELLRTCIRLTIEDCASSRVPNQLIEPDSENNSDKRKENEEQEDVNEFCGVGAAVGGGGVMGYSLPLGANPDAYGRKKNTVGKKSKK